jgi:hypothetical protein
MFDKLFDFIEAVWEWFVFWVVLDPYEAGVVIQLGTYRRTLTGGVWLICPFGIDDVKYETVVRQTAYLDVQSVTSKDGKSLSLAGIVTFIITDIRKFLLEIDDGESDMVNMIYGIITDFVEAHDWDNIRGPQFNKKVLDKCRRDCENYCGVKIISIKWSDKATARNLRLWND